MHTYPMGGQELEKISQGMKFGYKNVRKPELGGTSGKGCGPSKQDPQNDMEDVRK